MTRIFGHFIALEMLGLWLVEFVPCMLALYIFLLPGGGSGWADVDALGHATTLALAISAVWVAVGLYQPEVCQENWRLFLGSAVGGLLTLPAVVAMDYLLRLNVTGVLGASAMRPVQFVLTWIAFLFATRFLFRLALRLDMFARRVVIVGTPADAAETRAAIARVRTGFFRVVGVAAPDDAASLAPAALRGQGVWAVLVTERCRGQVPGDVLMRSKSAGMHVYSDVEFREQQLRRIDLTHLAPDWLLYAPGLTRRPAEEIFGRALDIVIALGLLVFCAPVMLLAMLAIRLDSPGALLYRQERVGLHGRVFTLYKFRSMRSDAEAAGPAWAVRGDARVTRVGNFLRRSRIDELPQLLNVLRGEMAMVGPRPERPHFVEQLGRAIPFYGDRAAVRPGITGWAQVNYPYGASIEDARHKLSFDLYYIKRRSLFLDLVILFATVRVVLFQEGAR